MMLFVSVGLVELCLWTLVQLGSGGESWSYTECSTALRPEVEQLHVSSLSVVSSLLLGVASSSSHSLFSLLSLSVLEFGSMDWSSVVFVSEFDLVCSLLYSGSDSVGCSNVIISSIRLSVDSLDRFSLSELFGDSMCSSSVEKSAQLSMSLLLIPVADGIFGSLLGSVDSTAFPGFLRCCVSVVSGL